MRNKIILVLIFFLVFNNIKAQDIWIEGLFTPDSGIERFIGIVESYENIIKIINEMKIIEEELKEDMLSINDLVDSYRGALVGKEAESLKKINFYSRRMVYYINNIGRIINEKNVIFDERRYNLKDIEEDGKLEEEYFELLKGVNIVRQNEESELLRRTRGAIKRKYSIFLGYKLDFNEISGIFYRKSLEIKMFIVIMGRGIVEDREEIIKSRKGNNSIDREINYQYNRNQEIEKRVKNIEYLIEMQENIFNNSKKYILE